MKIIEDRRIIVKDVLAQLESKKIVAHCGNYMRLLECEAGYVHGIVEGEGGAAYTTPKKCEVCGIGAMFIASVDKYNEITIDDVEYCADVDDNEMLAHLERWWSCEEMRLVEAAFEGKICDDVEGYDDIAAHLVDWHQRQQDRGRSSNDILIDICNMMLRHPECVLRVAQEDQ